MHIFVLLYVYGEKLHTVFFDRLKRGKELKKTHTHWLVCISGIHVSRKKRHRTARLNETHPKDVKFNLMAISKTDGSREKCVNWQHVDLLRRASDAGGETTLAQPT